MSDLTEKWPCIFKEPFIRAEIDPRVQEAWKSKTGKDAPFGFLRKVWRQRHCATINPYGGQCPFDKLQCGAAFLACATDAINDSERSPRGWFWARARFSAAFRADHKPLARQQASQVPFRTDEPQRPRDPGDAPQGVPAGQGLPRTGSGPQRIGELLGAIDPRPHQGPFKNGKESQK